DSPPSKGGDFRIQKCPPFEGGQREAQGVNQARSLTQREDKATAERALSTSGRQVGTRSSLCESTFHLVGFCSRKEGVLFTGNSTENEMQLMIFMRTRSVIFISLMVATTTAWAQE